MKKFILSAALALACFTAQAKNEAIKNDDDKNPKTKAKVVVETKTVKALSLPEGVGCTVYGFVSGVCGDEIMSSGIVHHASNCYFANIGLQIIKRSRALTLCN